MKQLYVATLLAAGMLIGACVAPQLAPEPSNAEGESIVRVKPEPVAWEYKLVTLQMDEAKLTALGADGWELVGIVQDTKIGYVDDLSKRLYFKRPKK